jgi:hypothetical protein
MTAKTASSQASCEENSPKPATHARIRLSGRAIARRREHAPLSANDAAPHHGGVHEQQNRQRQLNSALHDLGVDIDPDRRARTGG